MTLVLTQSATAVTVNAPATFGSVGGTGPYVYSVDPGGPGGIIDPGTGLYYAPAVVSSDPKLTYDTVRVTDSLADTAITQILVGSPLLLFCEIIQKEMGLTPGRVYLWDQKIMQPHDYDLYIAVSMPSCKPFANINKQVSVGDQLVSEQSVNMQALVDIDVISRGPTARDRKEEVVMALGSNYAESQQEANSFYIGQLPPSSRMLNLSDVDGAAIPYRYKISVQMQYFITKTSVVEYYDQFTNEEFTNP